MFEWPFHRLMDEGGDPGGGGADPPSKDPPADPPKSEDPPKDPPPPATVSVDVLPEELRDRPEAEQKFILEHMVSSLGTRSQEVQTLKEQLAELRGEIRKPPDEPDPNEGKTMGELMLEDPEAAMDRYMDSKGYVKAFTDLSGRVGSAEYGMVSREIDDFAEFKDDVDALLKDGKLAPTEANVRGAYTMAVGSRALMEKAAAARGNNTIPPSPPPPPEGDEVKGTITKLETEIAAAHNMSPEEWIEARDKPLEVKLPTG